MAAVELGTMELIGRVFRLFGNKRRIYINADTCARRTFHLYLGDYLIHVHLGSIVNPGDGIHLDTASPHWKRLWEELGSPGRAGQLITMDGYLYWMCEYGMVTSFSLFCFSLITS